MSPPPSLSHLRRTVGVVSDSPSPDRTGSVGVGMAGASDTLTSTSTRVLSINTNAADDGMSDGIRTLGQSVNDDLGWVLRLARPARSMP
ncbi:hypothetical protein DFH11DRAFT_1600636, partial [Phellopilus nigrolimitatus]